MSNKKKSNLMVYHGKEHHKFGDKCEFCDMVKKEYSEISKQRKWQIKRKKKK